MKGVTRYQLELLSTLRRLEATSGRLTDFDQLLQTLSWMPSKESAQFTVRALITRGFIAKAPLEARRGRNRVCYRLLEAGFTVLDPRRLAEKTDLKGVKTGGEKALKPVLPELLKFPETGLFFPGIVR